MPRFTDPRVVYAIQRRCEKEARRKNRAAVLQALERAGAANLAELMELTGLSRTECGLAVDQLKVAYLILEEPDGVFGLCVWRN